MARPCVRDLTLGFPSRCGLFTLHSCLFSCRELTCLSLTGCRIPPAPAGLARFPNLKTLRLERVFVVAQEHAGREFAALIASSPVLEDVEIGFVQFDGDGPDVLSFPLSECRGFITTKDSDEEISPDKARPRRRQRLKSESVAQVEQLRGELQNLENEKEQVVEDRLRLNKEISVLYKELDKHNSYAKTALQLLSKGRNTTFSDLDQRTSRHAVARASSSDHPGTSRQGGTPADTAIDDSRADPPENRAVSDPGNAHLDSPDVAINCAADTHPKSQEDHD
ncbi:hypothetical protein BAE44_0013729 [Dichanthelium oligosanthes]|uniref:F-box/LRR-repeat protein 15/At3g58940/PEG3-like LRR domain-containing protein n=1 Tax=Dichanthelium oligosanthes TaxID=888268 RepID=A0A1E5VJE4_9POAL|nr:hypothetical protein BAE44_0013729 [Dichanthelium oligosanthes]